MDNKELLKEFDRLHKKLESPIINYEISSHLNRKKVSFLTKIDAKDIDNTEVVENNTRLLIKEAEDRGIDIKNDFERVVGFHGEDFINNKVTIVINYFIDK